MLPDGDYEINEEDEERLNLLRAITYDKKENDRHGDEEYYEEGAPEEEDEEGGNLENYKGIYFNEEPGTKF